MSRVSNRWVVSTAEIPTKEAGFLIWETLRSSERYYTVSLSWLTGRGAYSFRWLHFFFFCSKIDTVTAWKRWTDQGWIFLIWETHIHSAVQPEDGYLSTSFRTNYFCLMGRGGYKYSVRKNQVHHASHLVIFSEAPLMLYLVPPPKKRSYTALNRKPLLHLAPPKSLLFLTPPKNRLIQRKKKGLIPRPAENRSHTSLKQKKKKRKTMDNSPWPGNNRIQPTLLAVVLLFHLPSDNVRRLFLIICTIHL